MKKNYRLEDLTPAEILNEMLDLSSELCERSQRDFRDGLKTGSEVKDIAVKELAAVKEIELAIGTARSIFEETGKIKGD
jgi:hypothetical protein